MQKIITLLAALFFVINVHAQNSPQILCGYDIAVESMESKFPGYKEQVQEVFKAAKDKAAVGLKNNDSIYTVKVVIHVVYKEAEENLHDSVLLNQMTILNEDFRRMNMDASNIRQEFEDVVGDPKIEFQLEEIIRVQTDVLFEPSLYELPDYVKLSSEGGSDAWDTERYLNIWVCALQPITIGGIPLGIILGYAYPPAGLSNWPPDVAAPSPETEGVVIDYRMFGRNNPHTVDAGYGLVIDAFGRTPVHEVGHYLGLRHIWGDGGFGQDGCDVDDGVDDTPNAGTQSNWDCDYNKNSCTDASNDLPDMIENYMDYADETCMNSFTQGQIDIMRAVLEDQRKGLIEDGVGIGLVPNVQVLVAPNPSRGWLNIRLAEYPIESLSIMNASGKLVRELHVNGHDAELHLEEPGLYFLQINLGEEIGTLSKKVLIVY